MIAGYDNILHKIFKLKVELKLKIFIKKIFFWEKGRKERGDFHKNLKMLITVNSSVSQRNTQGRNSEASWEDVDEGNKYNGWCGQRKHGSVWKMPNLGLRHLTTWELGRREDQLVHHKRIAG